MQTATVKNALDISRLDNVQRIADGSIRAACPACRAAGSDKSGDHLLIKPSGQYGCAVHPNDGAHRQEIFRLAAPPSDKAHNNGHTKTIVSTYDYRDESGTLRFQVCRYVPKDFRQRRPDGEGKWIWGLTEGEYVQLTNGDWIKPKKTGGQSTGARKTFDAQKPFLFRLPEILQDVKRGLPIFICEGEKDVLAMVEHGFSATCNPGGARKWQDSFSETLRGADCIVIADKDADGREHAQLIAGKLRGAAKTIRVIELPDMNGKPVKDAADFIAAGGDASQITALVDVTPEWMPQDHGQNGHSFLTPSEWFSKKFPSLAGEYGDAILEAMDEEGIISTKDIGEDFLAATLGEKGSPDAPTVFVPTEERFYTYTSGEGIFSQQREPVLLARLSKLLLECARACKSGCETQTLEFRFRDSASLGGVLRKARGLLETPPDFFSSDLTEYIPCANGMLRLKDKELLPFSPMYRRRNKLAVPFDLTARCPLFLDTLMRLALDNDELDLLQRWCGLALIGENIAQRILILTGTPGGGKGTFVRVLTGIIGQTNLASLRPHLLGERFELGRFLGKTLLYGADVPENFLNQRGASVLKSLTGYDPVTLEFKNSNESPSIVCRFNVIVTCNSRLTVHLEGDTDAWRRRLVIVEYHNPKPDKVIADLDKRILTTEASGVLNWMLDGLDKIRADDWQLVLTANQQASVDNLLLESDGHMVFARECLKRDGSPSLTVPDCFAAYVEFCTRRGWTALTRNKFSTVIGDVVVRQFGITLRHDIPDANRKMQRGWKGLALTENFTQPTGETPSEVSDTSAPDNSDTLFPVQPEKNPDEEAIEL